MTSHDQDNKLDRLEHEANRWVTLLVSGEARAPDVEVISQWRKQSPAHEAAFSAAVRQWKNFGPAGQRLRARPDVDVWKPSAAMISRRALAGGALAAGLVGYAAAKPPLGLWPSFTELTADYRTATGEQKSITLAENISVRMNSQTSIAVQTAEEDRDQVRLIMGEAAFNTSSRLLVVSAADGRTIARRAHFDVRNLGEAVCVTCFDGDLRVELGGQTVTVGSKRQVRYDRGGFHGEAAIDPAEAEAWQNGFLIFRFTPLSDVVAEINRYRPGKVILMNASLGQTPVNGRFSIQHMDDALSWIEQSFGATSRKLPGGILLLS